MKKHFVYVVRCSDDSLYTGYTIDINRRISEHNRGKGAKYTRGRIPVHLKYIEECKTKKEGLRREHEIKKLSKKQKENMIEKNAL